MTSLSSPPKDAERRCRDEVQRLSERGVPLVSLDGGSASASALCRNKRSASGNHDLRSGTGARVHRPSCAAAAASSRAIARSRPRESQAWDLRVHRRIAFDRRVVDRPSGIRSGRHHRRRSATKRCSRGASRATRSNQSAETSSLKSRGVTALRSKALSDDALEDPAPEIPGVCFERSPSSSPQRLRTRAGERVHRCHERRSWLPEADLSFNGRGQTQMRIRIETAPRRA